MVRVELPILIAAFGLLYIYVIPSDPFWLKLTFKLIPMALILLYAFLRMPRQKSAAHWIVFIGLFFCALGDGLLHWFVVGLSAFLVGHLFYLTGFFRGWNYSVSRFWTIAPLAVFAAYMIWTFIDALSTGDQSSLIVPVVFYILVITTMAWSAIMTGQKWIILGSLLFMISDSILAWNKFITDVPYSGPLIMLTYYSAQFFIAHNMKVLDPSHADVKTTVAG